MVEQARLIEAGVYALYVWSVALLSRDKTGLSMKL
jgi:hypothetical protein